MPLQAGITITGLGPGAPGHITMSAWEALRASTCTFLRTSRHPVVSWLVKEGISFSTFDYLYEQSPAFEEVYAGICQAVITAARRESVLYAVPGHPLVAEESVRLIIEAAERENISVCIQPALSFLDAIMTALKLNPGACFQVVDGLRIDDSMPLPARPAVITQVYSRLVAADVKVSLLEYYPPGHLITVVRGAGIPGEQRIENIPLSELDRLDWVDYLTSLYVPEVGSQRSEAGDQGKNETGTDDGDRVYGQAIIDGEEPGESEGVEVIRVNDNTNTGSDNGRRTLNISRRLCRFPLDPLVNLLARLRGKGGCPWDLEQDHLTLRPYLLEETYEVLEALNEEDMYKLCEELGDLLLQIVFHAQIASENRLFDMNDVVNGISEKITRRHPHVFGSATARNSYEVTLNWEKIKAGEKGRNKPASLLDSVSMALPALMRAVKLQKKAASVGFDWPDYRGAMEKYHEELDELRHAISTGDEKQVEKEMGDLLFSVVNLARLLGVEPESALASTSEKFVKRFRYIENRARYTGKELSKCSLSELDAWWEEAKKQEKK
ncbi:nucleoside triphosphate pyrophosphohydrolase [Pelotomaculum sp. PtaB.Bin117]|uniref:nucleoside triphosphate pyrophosphohydrolase n=1 Tax=Pelotomaculum sp. PtaB.Bin117 TaxID=1811694 RepID=UPI0009CB3236|nr:nucleoside triphosphate pyrophosphohydrolase [Pelotomaculum sp. PtaB.Bin117]OPX91742.1 MAG: Nucleoside triphosphate pyrophosphohydrolase [Pelotomaculum sp. PtaB.Bin117]